ncbi:hypothetical protein [Salinibacterium sp. ZJ70]|uniref:hypothetical protein n=1 Tax=Salinibacterium sp. ZJ70 TaxID=2708084 RepID=UPI0014207DF5|nr:hypothetical protein [Salinibacterium sp. ZJ70]
MWTRSRRALAAALPVGAAIGGAIGLVFCLGMLGRFQDQGGWGALAYSVALGTALGLATAAAAAAGAALAVLLTRSSSRRNDLFRRTVVIGAACGAALLWMGLGVVDGAFFDGWAGFGVFGAVGVVAGIIAAIASEALIVRAERREHETTLERA